MGLALRLSFAFVLLLIASGEALAARVALVIGNGRYEGVAPLTNPVNDAGDIALELRRLGFEVIEGYDLGKREMEEKIGAFSDRLAGAEAGVLYYAGHGIAVAGRNFIVPVDAHLDAPAKLKFESIAIDDIADMMREQTGVSVLILDACRNNPFGRAAKPASRGAAEAGLQASASYAGAYTVYSAQDGSVALDGKGRNSPFATALLRRIATPGLSVETVMGQVKADVEEATQGFQSPDAKGLLTRSFSFAPGEQVATRSVALETQTGASAPNRLADQAALKRFVETQYLDPDTVNMEATVKRMYAENVSSFGYFVSNAELIPAKRNYFGQFTKWKLSLTPGTLFIDFPTNDAAKLVFTMHYIYWPKTGAAAAEGNIKVGLDMVRQGTEWKIQSEAAVE